MHLLYSYLFSLGLVSHLTNAAPLTLATSGQPTDAELNDPTFGPVPSETKYYSDYRGKEAPFPAKNATPILNTTSEPDGADDLLFQNLLSAEWVVFSFYQQGVETFNKSAFADLGFPDTTYDRIQEIRDNEAGHLRLFQDSISNNNIKPGPCSYEYGFGTDAKLFLALQADIELSSMSFLTGLVLGAKLDASKAALAAVGFTETRHEVWALMDIWNVSPFAGAVDTAFPYPNEILDITTEFIVSGSCPIENPPYPSPSQNLPRLEVSSNTTGFAPGDKLEFVYEFEPAFVAGVDYYAVYYHGLFTISVPFNPQTNTSMIPEEFEAKGLILVVIANAIGAPTLESVVAGPLSLYQQPASLNQVDSL